MNTIINENDNNGTELDDNLISKVDASLLAFSGCKLSDTPVRLYAFSEAVLAYIKWETTDDPITTLFDQKMSQKDRLFVAICFVRLLSINDDNFQQDRDFRIKVLNLFESVLIDNLYKDVGITYRLQTHEKLSRLKDAVPKAESELRDALDTLISFDRLEDFREHYMKALNAPITKNIILPFVPKRLFHRSKLSEIFETIRQYRQSGSSNIRQNYEFAQKVIKEYIGDARSIKTKYTDMFITTMAERLEELLLRDFLDSDYGQPATLEIKAIDKRYPFHQNDQLLKLGFSLNNIGPGYAYKVSIIATESENIKVLRPELHLGGLEPGLQNVELSAKVLSPSESATVDLGVFWENADGTEQDQTFSFSLYGQRKDINWQNLETEDPYSLEPIETYEQLVGRKEIVNNMVRQARSRSAGSSYVYGQKRVGKTSIAKALKSRLNDQENYLIVYLEGGEYIDPDAQKTIANLGRSICEKIKTGNKSFSNIRTPVFENAIAPLTGFLNNAHEQAPDLRFIFILDEFDELPIDLYRRGALADAFFLTLRTISGMPYCGLILVGGERMEFIMSCQGDVLNKFLVITVDYFDKENQWSDFTELVRKPTKDWLEITDQAILCLYDQTAGNPYYTIFVCRELFMLLVERKDCYVTVSEIEEATRRAIKRIAVNGFQHFWEDGIFEVSGDRVEEISMRRRRILLAVANILREKGKASKEDIMAQEIVATCKDSIDGELRRFVERRVLVEDKGFYECKVPFFKVWLTTRGVNAILTTFTDLDAILERQKREEVSFVKPEEIIELANRWQDFQYLGVRVGEEHIRAWLNQFGEYSNQRLMFKILQSMKVYSEIQLRTKLKEAHGVVTRGLGRYIKYKQQKRSDILVSYLGGAGKSGGAIFARTYASVNEIYLSNVIELNKISQEIEKNRDIQAIILIDDIIGSGGTLQTQLKILGEDHGEILRKQNIPLHYIAVTGFEESLNEIEKTIEDIKIPIKVHICDLLDQTDKCFSDNSRILPDPQERSRALKVAQELGEPLVRQNSLGWGDCQATVVFPHNCPNNDLPILWAESKNPPWRPLFKRITN